MNKLVTLTAAALAAMSFATSASAGEAPSRTIALSNLSTPAGVEAFNREVRYAAKAVCGDFAGVRSLAETRAISRCVDATVASHSREMQAAAPAVPAA